MDPRLESYGFPELHEAVSEIIRRHSTNPEDVRDLALAGRDLTWVGRVLDLGCGFGFMAEALAPRLPAGAEVVGIDAWEANRRPFLRRVKQAGRRADFLALEIRDRLPFPAASFDLAVSSFSLYFFPEIIPEVARVLRPGGRFLALTHRQASLVDLLRTTGLSDREGPLLDLVGGFSAENGAARLQRCFGNVRPLDFRNSLVFSSSRDEDLLTYLSFKLRLLVECREDLCSWFEQGLIERLCESSVRGEVRLSKDEVAFWAEEPMACGAFGEGWEPHARGEVAEVRCRGA